MLAPKATLMSLGACLALAATACKSTRNAGQVKSDTVDATPVLGTGTFAFPAWAELSAGEFFAEGPTDREGYPVAGDNRITISGVSTTFSDDVVKDGLNINAPGIFAFNTKRVEYAVQSMTHQSIVVNCLRVGEQVFGCRTPVLLKGSVRIDTHYDREGTANRQTETLNDSTGKNVPLNFDAADLARAGDAWPPKGDGTLDVQYWMSNKGFAHVTCLVFNGRKIGCGL